MSDFDDAQAFYHPLSDQPAPLYIPDAWTAEHVGLRLVEAFQTLEALPVKAGGRSAWPVYPYEPDDIDAQKEQRQKEQEARRGRADAQRMRSNPTTEAISHMNRCFDWLWILDHQAPGSTRTVVAWATHEAREFDSEGDRRLELKAARLGLELVADQLNIRREAVF